jgi:hypothetical protein
MGIPYKTASEGKQVLPGKNSPIFTTLNAIAKKNDQNRQYTVANEIVSLTIAQYLHLPIPPGGIVMDQTNTYPYFFSLELLPGTAKPTPVINARQVAHQHPELAWGIILFDILLINKDRKPRNLMLDEQSNALYIFDHGNCIYGAAGKNKVEFHKDLIGIGDFHCLAKNMTSLDSYSTWIDIFYEMPNTFIQKSVEKGLNVGFSKADCDYISKVLINRKNRLHEFIVKQIIKFSRLDIHSKNTLKEMTVFGRISR